MNTKIVLSFLLFALVASGNTVVQDDFVKFTESYGRVYKTVRETVKRYDIFSNNWNRIQHFNTVNHGNKSYSIGINKFSDMTEIEKIGRNSNRMLSPNNFVKNCTKGGIDGINDIILPAAPKSFDWRDQGKVTPVKDQGDCGSCWAMATIATVESAFAIKYNKTLRFSEQQLVDCSLDWGNYGCDGGLMDSAFRYITDTGGSCSEEDYPYTGRDQDCNADWCRPFVQIRGCVDVSPDMEEHMAQLVAYIGPLSIAVNAMPFMDYESGVFNDTCGPDLDHGVTIVGYGTDPKSGLDYWSVKNSWGYDWGEKGYIRLSRGKKQCGLDLYVSYPVVR